MGDAALLGLAAAASYGLGDFVSGTLARRMPPLVLLALGQGAALLVLVPVTLAAAAGLDAAAAGWGALAGVGGAVGGYCFARGFRAGRFGVVAPAASVTAAGLPVLADAAAGVRLGAVAGTGVVLAIVAVVLVGLREPGPHCRASGLGWGLGAGAAHAAMYVLLGHAATSSGLLAVTAAFAATALLALAAVVVTGRRTPPLRLRAGQAPGVVAVGLLAAGGTVAFTLGAGAGGVGVAAVVTELSPVVTAVLARLVLGEALPPLRVAGLLLAVAAGVLVGLG